jgi:hypothetical protein
VFQDTVKLLARAEQSPRADNERDDQHEKRHYVGEQRIDVLDRENFGGGDDAGAKKRAKQAVEAADQGHGKRLQPDDRHGAGQAGVERDQHTRDRSR